MADLDALKAARSASGKLGGRPKAKQKQNKSKPKANESNCFSHGKQTESKPKAKKSDLIGLDLIGLEESRAEETEEEPKDTPPRKAAYSIVFEIFWKQYPRRVGKDAAWKAWESRRRLGTLPSNDVLASAIDTQKRSPAWVKDSGQYIPNPATWLNQGRWQDEQASAPQSSGIKYADF
jgi:hypothetical protein